jgi:hypothetical protein
MTKATAALALALALGLALGLALALALGLLVRRAGSEGWFGGLSEGCFGGLLRRLGCPHADRSFMRSVMGRGGQQRIERGAPHWRVCACGGRRAAGGRAGGRAAGWQGGRRAAG